MPGGEGEKKNFPPFNILALFSRVRGLFTRKKHVPERLLCVPKVESLLSLVRGLSFFSLCHIYFGKFDDATRCSNIKGDETAN